MSAKTILITGCSSGIGHDAAHALRARGWRVFAACRKAQDCDRLRAEGFDSPRMDYDDEDSLRNGLAEVLDTTGGTLDALFNNGAYAIPGPVEDIPTEALRSIFQSNLIGWHDLTRQVPKLIEMVLNGDDIAINTMIAMLAENGWDGNAILAHLIEPTARALGDAWLSDDCSELDLAIGLSMLQLAGHAVRSTPTPAALRNSRYSILLATAPGEKHGLGTSLLAAVPPDRTLYHHRALPPAVPEETVPVPR